MADEDYIAQQVSRNMQRASRRTSGQEYSLSQNTPVGRLDFPTAPQFNFRPNNTRSVVADYGQQQPDLMRPRVPKGIGTAIGAGIDYMYGRADKDKKSGKKKDGEPTPDAPSGEGGFPQLNTGERPRLGLPSGSRPGLPSGNKTPGSYPAVYDDYIDAEIVDEVGPTPPPKPRQLQDIIDVEWQEVFRELPVTPGTVRQIGSTGAARSPLGLPPSSGTTSRSPSAGREVRALGAGQRPAEPGPIALGPGPMAPTQTSPNVGSNVTVAHGLTWSVNEKNDWTPLGDDTRPEDFFKRPGPMGANSPRNVAARQARAAARRRNNQ